MTSEGRPYARFRRALERGHLWAAEDAARELDSVSLDDAFRLVELYSIEESPKFQPAARRWLVRYLEEREPTLREFAQTATMLAESGTWPKDADAR